MIRPLRETAWIDGCRGLAMLYNTTMRVLTAFTEPHSGTQSLLLMFFVLGGYVSARKSLVLMQRGDYRSRAELVKTLSTSAFRRGFRLYLPAFVSTLITAVASYIGLFETIRPFVAKEEIKTYFPGSNPPDPLRRSTTLTRQLQYWLYDVGPLANVWTAKRHVPRHNPHLWTLQCEFLSSLHLYITLIVCVRLKPWTRLLTLLMLSQYHMIAGRRYEVMLFFFGAALAQAELMLNAASRSLIYNLSSVNFLVKKGVWIAALYTSIVLMFYPLPGLFNQQAYAEKYAIIRLLDAMTPVNYPEKDKLFDGIGVVLFFVCIMVSSPESWARRALTNNFAQYFGRMFFGTILVEGAVLNAGGFLVPHLFWAWSGDYQRSKPDAWLSVALSSEEKRTIAGLVVAELVNIPVLILLGDLFMRVVVKRCMIVMFLIENLVFVSDAEPDRSLQNGKPAHKIL